MVHNGIEVPRSGTFWTHEKSGRRYYVHFVTNLRATKPEYVAQIVYEDECSGVWSRPLTEWYASFTPAPPLFKRIQND